MTPLQQFMNIDDLAVLREPAMPAPRSVPKVILHALRQVGKGCDFNFDVVSTDRIVCSELVYHTYSHQQWPTARYLGRATISPDNVALRACQGRYSTSCCCSTTARQSMATCRDSWPGC